jgi:hypothetical protein
MRILVSALALLAACTKPTPAPADPQQPPPRCPQDESGNGVCPCENGSDLRPACGEDFTEACADLGEGAAFECTEACESGGCCAGQCTVPPR